MNDKKEKLKKIVMEFFSTEEAKRIIGEDLVDHLYSRNCYVIDTIDDVVDLLPRPKFFVVENDVKKYPGWDQYMLLELTPDINWDGHEYAVQYDFPAAYKRTIYESPGYRNIDQREMFQIEAIVKYKELMGSATDVSIDDREQH